MQLLLLLVVLSVSIVSAQEPAEDLFEFYTCFSGIDVSAGCKYCGGGFIYPRDDQVVEVGSKPFNYTCRLNPDHKYMKEQGLNASNLFFQDRIEETAIFKIPETQIINETAIVYTFDPVEVIEREISCKIRTNDKADYNDDGINGICRRHVAVGEKSIKPTNFQCISNNWQDLNCTWDVPYNPVPSEYTLHWIATGRHGIFMECPKTLPNGDPMLPNQCYISLRTTPPYRQPVEIYQFILIGKNALDQDIGGTSYKFPVNVYSVVRPGPPEIVGLTATTNSLELEFKVPHGIVGFRPGVISEIRYHSDFDPTWVKVDTSQWDRNKKSYSLTIENLHPNLNYTVEIRLLSSKANASDARLWSNVARASARTPPTLPSMPPLTTPGSFEIVGEFKERRIFVYWQKIPFTDQNADEFRYVVSNVEEEGLVVPRNPIKITSAYAEFPQMSLRNYTFQVVSQNEIGTSNSTSTVLVDSYDRLHGLHPKSFTKIAYDDYNFEVSWNPPEKEELIESYTIFWCRSETNRDRPYQCEGRLDWKHVSKSERIVNVTLPTADIYQFAVSANAKDRSSGMVWATCTILHNKVVGKLKTVSISHVKKSSMKVHWRLDCSDRVGIVTGYKISYCPISLPNDTTTCEEDEDFTVTTTETKSSVTLTALRPWTYYKVGVSVLTRAGESEISDYRVNRTARDRPASPPTNLVTKLVASDRVTVFWQEPKIPNGPISSYNMRINYTDFKGSVFKREYNFRVEKIGISQDLNFGQMFNQTFENLEFYVDYQVALAACTWLPQVKEDLCGHQWGSAGFRTGIGKSGPMPIPLVKFRNQTEATVRWGHLFHKGGPVIKRYDLHVTHLITNATSIIPIEGEHNEFTIDLLSLGDEDEWAPECRNHSISSTYKFSIRAVTVDPSTGEVFLGDWSPFELIDGYCSGDSVTPYCIARGALCDGHVNCIWSKEDEKNCASDIKEGIALVYVLVTAGVVLVLVFVILCCHARVHELWKEYIFMEKVDPKSGLQPSLGDSEMTEHPLKTHLQSGPRVEEDTYERQPPPHEASGQSEALLRSRINIGGDTASGTDSSHTVDSEPDGGLEDHERSFTSSSSTTSSISGGSNGKHIPVALGIHPYDSCNAKPKQAQIQLGFGTKPFTEIVPTVAFPETNANGYSRFVASNIGPWENNVHSPTSPLNGLIPPGYSKVGVAPTSDYVSFEEARNAQHDVLPCHHPHPSQLRSTGYTSLAEAARESSAANMSTPNPNRGYLKASAEAVPPPVAITSGYVPHSEVIPSSKGVVAPDSRLFEQQHLEDRLSDPVLLSQMSQPLAQQQIPYDSPSTSKVSPYQPFPQINSSRSPEDGSAVLTSGYVQAAPQAASPSIPTTPTTNGDVDDECNKALVMSPKSLHVESKSPYSKVFTTIQNGKSSMV